MGAVGGLLGVSGGASGTGFSGPEKADLQNPVTAEQIAAGQTGATNSLDSSQRLLDALQGQNGATNQSRTYDQNQGLMYQLSGNNPVKTQAGATAQQQRLNTGLDHLDGTGVMKSAIGQQGSLAKQLGGAGGIGLQTGAAGGLQNVLGQQQATAAQLQGIANGAGPNPAQAAFNQATGQNVANQAALMAGQRGAGANVGLLARQAAMQGAGIEQQAAGQNAVQQAQQQLGAINALGAQQQAMAGTNQNIAGIGSGLTAAQAAAIGAQYGQGAGAINQQQTGIGQQFGQGATTLGQQKDLLAANAGIAQNQVGNLTSATGTNMQGNISNAGQLIGAQGQYNSTQAGQQASVNAANAGMAQTSMKGQQDLIGGAVNGAGAAIASLAEGGEVDTPPALIAAPSALNAPPPTGPSSSFGQFLQGWGAPQPKIDAGETPKVEEKPKDGSDLKNGMSNLAKAGLMAALAANGGSVHDMRTGGGVQAKRPEEKAVKAGNSYANDKIKAYLSDGEVVIPRSVMQSGDPARGAADFVAKVMAKRGKAS